MNINLGGKYTYSFENNILNVEKRGTHYVNIFEEINYINDISAIIGKNSSGKTTILRVINAIFSNLDLLLEYIIIFEQSEQVYCYSNYHKTHELHINKKDIRIIGKTEFLKMQKKYKLIYSSTVFDKSDTFMDNEKLIDISTNKLLREYIGKSSNYSTNRSSKGKDLVHDFKKSEIGKKVEYFRKLDSLKKGNNISNFTSLFQFPEELEIEICWDDEELDRLFKEASEANENLVESMTKLYSQIKEVEYLPDTISDNWKEKIFNGQFAFITIFEVFSKISSVYNKEIEDIIEDFVGYVDKNLEKIDFMEECRRILTRILKRERKVIVTDDKESKAIETKYSHIVDVYNNSLNEIEELIEVVELVEENGLEYHKIVDILEQFNETQQRVVPDLIEVPGLGYIQGEVSKLQNQIENFKNLRLSTDDIFQSYLEDLNEILIEEILGIFKDISKYIVSIINYIKNTVDLVENDIKKARKVKQTYVEEDKEVIEYVNDINNLFNLFDMLVNRGQVKIYSPEEYVTLKCKWTSRELNTFLDFYQNIEMKLISMEYHHEDISTGHRAYLDVFTRISYELGKLRGNDKEILLLIDEADIFLHPEIQVKYLENILAFLNLFMDGRKFQIILTSNSPFIISDLPNSNIVYIDNMKTELFKPDKTLGANIHDLLSNSFFMSEGTVGEYSKRIINKLIDNIKCKNNKDYTYNAIQLIGEPVVRKRLELMYEKAFIEDEIQLQIEECEKRLAYLKRRKDEKEIK